ncbi:MAG TPA: AAA family ATPase, partial [Polyangiales bacterium]|nr:AAA family ATPase [Polyangiales bacterium]
MTHVGPSKDLVGTPAYAAPELVNLQPLDARTDLYALGATLYYALTGRNAYPARDFTDLLQLWRKPIRRPSELAPNIPEALDQLVVDLLQLDPKARPASATEVLERLAPLDVRPSALGIPVEAQAYLSTPAFVGREPELSRVRSNLQRARARRGGATLVAAAPGLGRSRFLDATVLSGKLQGMAVLRAYAEESEPGEYRAVRALLLQLKAAMPDEVMRVAAPLLPVLGHIVPELAGGAELQAFDDRSALRPQLQHALRRVLREVSAQQPLLMAIDDLPLLDEPSIAAIALLAREVSDVAVQIVATAPADFVPGVDSAYRLYSELAVRISLHALT